MATLIKPPPLDSSKAPIENILELVQLTDIDPNLFTNAQPLWHPPGARGVYGGSIIAQCLAAAQKTVPDNFSVHSMHCYFVLAGDASIPVIFSVERVREGKSFATRTVQARQRGKPIFTTTLSFKRENSAGKQTVNHAAKMPQVPPPSNEFHGFPQGADGPIEAQKIEIANSTNQPMLEVLVDDSHLLDDSPDPGQKRVRQWIKARGTISGSGGHEAHLSALAYMSDSYFIGTIARVHKLWRWASRREGGSKSTVDEEVIKKLLEMDDEKLKQLPGVDDQMVKQLRNGEPISMPVNRQKRPEVGMMVSLDHTIYFHRQRDFRADEWMMAETWSNWTGDGRGLVYQHIFSQDGQLIASCVQEVSQIYQRRSSQTLTTVLRDLYA